MANKYPLPNVNKPKEDAPVPSGAGLGAKIENALTRFLQRVTLWSLDFIGDLLVDIFDNSMKILQPGLSRMTAPLVAELKDVPGLPPYLRQFIDNIESEKGESKFLMQVFGYLSLFAGWFSGGMAPMGRILGYAIDTQVRSNRPAPAELVDIHKRGLLSDEEYRLAMGDMGVYQLHQEAIEKLYDDNANPDDLIFGLIRGLYGEADFYDRMKKAGIPKGIQDIQREKANVYPPIQDILRMMVKEAFNDEATAKYGLQEDYPDAATDYAAKQGLSDFWTRAYWAAHWQLPSPNQVFEMLHRGVIDQSTVDQYLKFADYSPYWREKMRDISYNVLTRVDVRRLYQAGLIDREKVLTEYKRMGYMPEDAELLTQFAETGASTRERDLTKADIIGLYKDGLQDKQETISDLVKMGYDEEEAGDLLKRADFDIKKAEKTNALNYTEERYKLGSIGKTEAGNELSLAGLSQTAIDRYLLEWDRQLESSVAIPTVSEATRFFIAGTISEDDFRAVLSRRNYDGRYIEWFVKDAQAKKQAAQGAENA